MPPDRRGVLLVVLLALVAVAAVVLFEVLGTVFFAITVAYVLVPFKRRIADRGLSSWWASVGTAVLATFAVFVLLAASALITYRRREPLLDVVTSLPSEFAVQLLGATTVVKLSDVVAPVQNFLSRGLLDAVQALPGLVLKLTLFAFLVFGLLVRHAEAERALLGPVPPLYYDIASAFATRARGTLYAIYVLQAATALGTFALAAPTFLLLGYQYPWTLAFAAALMQFLPIVGPSLLVGGLAVSHLAVGDVAGALLVFVVGEITVAWLPDVLIRPRLSRETANLSGTLYFVGFIGGLLTVGAVGVIAGPLVVALVVEATSLLAAEQTQTERPVA